MSKPAEVTWKFRENLATGGEKDDDGGSLVAGCDFVSYFFSSSRCSMNVARPQAIVDDYTCCFHLFYSSLPYNETLFSFFINFFAPLARSELKCSSQCIQWGDGRGVARRREENNIKKSPRERAGEEKIKCKKGRDRAARVEHATAMTKVAFFQLVSDLSSLLARHHASLLPFGLFQRCLFVPFCVAFSVVCRLFNPFVLLHCV